MWIWQHTTLNTTTRRNQYHQALLRPCHSHYPHRVGYRWKIHHPSLLKYKDGQSLTWWWSRLLLLPLLVTTTIILGHPKRTPLSAPMGHSHFESRAPTIPGRRLRQATQRWYSAPVVPHSFKLVVKRSYYIASSVKKSRRLRYVVVVVTTTTTSRRWTMTGLL